MLLHEKLAAFRLLLASNSPRRRELMTAAGLPYVMAEPFGWSAIRPISPPMPSRPIYRV